MSLGKTLSRALQPALLHDDMWQAYEIVTTPFDRPLQQRLGQPTIVVVDAQGAVYVATDPKRFPPMQPLASLGALSAQTGGRHLAAERCADWCWKTSTRS